MTTTTTSQADTIKALVETDAFDYRRTLTITPNTFGGYDFTTWSGNAARLAFDDDTMYVYPMHADGPYGDAASFRGFPLNVVAAVITATLR